MTLREKPVNLNNGLFNNLKDTIRIKWPSLWQIANAVEEILKSGSNQELPACHFSLALISKCQLYMCFEFTVCEIQGIFSL